MWWITRWTLDSIHYTLDSIHLTLGFIHMTNPAFTVPRSMGRVIVTW